MALGVRRMVLSVCASLVGATLLTTQGASPGQADPTGCPFDPLQTYSWQGGPGSSGLWTNGDWSVPAGYVNPSPNDYGDPEPDPQPSFACIGPGVTVHLDMSNDFMVEIQGLYLGPNSVLDIGRGTGVFVMSQDPTEESYAAPGSLITVSGGSLGGEGQLRTVGSVVVSSTTSGASSLTSTPLSQAPGSLQGRLVIGPSARLEFPTLGVNVQRGYRVLLQGTATVARSGFISANYGTRFDIAPSGTLRLVGPGGYYQGFAEAQDLSVLANDGTILKSGAGTTSVVDAHYVQATGHVDVQAGTLAFADGTTYTAQVSPGTSLSTEKCGPHDATTPCPVETSGERDGEAVTLQVPASAGAAAGVRLLELPVPTVAARGTPRVTFDAQADVDTRGVRWRPSHPGVLTLRFAASRVGSGLRSLDYLQVSSRDAGPEHVVAPCLSTGRPPGKAKACVDRRPGSGTHLRQGSYYMVVRATRFSRWIVRRGQHDDTPPTLILPGRLRGQLGPVVRLKAGATEKGTLKASGYLKVAGRRLVLRADELRLRKPIRKGTLRLRLSPTAAQLLHQLGVGKGKAVLKLTATDRSGNHVTEKVTAKLR